MRLFLLFIVAIITIFLIVLIVIAFWNLSKLHEDLQQISKDLSCVKAAMIAQLKLETKELDYEEEMENSGTRNELKS